LCANEGIEVAEGNVAARAGSGFGVEPLQQLAAESLPAPELGSA
jgi:hypothetical protein